jgi:hypothetical protein
VEAENLKKSRQESKIKRIMKNNINIQSLILFLFLLTIVSCKKDKDPIEISDTVTTSIFGKVIDEAGIGVYGASVKAGDKSSTTDINGIFRINNAVLNKNHAFVKITKAGYFDGSRTFVATEGKIQNVEIKLLSKALKGTFSSTVGSTVTIAPNVTLEFPANAIKKSDGSIYTGVVNVFAAYLDPTDTEITVKMPGDLIGKRTDNSENALITYGMIKVELEDAGGNKLNIADGKEAIWTSEVPSALLSSAPATIPLWYFDNSTGLWKEEGTATLTGNKYVGNVSHFSWWNCDQPNSMVKLKLQLVDVNGIEIQNRRVFITTISNGITACNITDNNGFANGFVPQNTPLKLSYSDGCGNLVVIQNIGPFSIDTDLGAVVSPSATLSKYTGKITNCSGAGVSNGYIKYNNGTNTNFAVADANGNFTFTVQNCSGISNLNFSAYDIDGFQQGIAQSITISPGTTALGNISSCNSSIDEYFQFQVDGGNTVLLQNVIFKYDSAQAGTLVNCDNTPQTPYKSIQFLSNQVTNIGIYQISFLELTDGINPYFGTGTDLSDILHVVSQYPAVGGYIVGTIRGSFLQNGTSTSHYIEGSYRIKRVQ